MLYITNQIKEVSSKDNVKSINDFLLNNPILNKVNKEENKKRRRVLEFSVFDKETIYCTEYLIGSPAYWDFIVKSSEGWKQIKEAYKKSGCDVISI